jgi:hypothetical protein
MTWLRGDGRTIDVAHLAPRRRGAAGSAERVYITEDVTETRKLERGSWRNRRRWRRSASLTGGIAHDYHNILTVITGIDRDPGGGRGR